MYALMMMRYYLDEIIRGDKTTDARLRPTDIRGTIALGDSSNDRIHAVAELTDCREITYEEFVRWHRTGPFADVEFAPYHEGLPCYEYVLRDVRPLPLPVKVGNPSGERMWLTLPDEVSRNLFSQRTLF